MIDVHSPRLPLTVGLPGALIEELKTLAREKKLSVDDLVMEACLQYTEPCSWERDFKEWQRQHADESRQEAVIDDEEMGRSATSEERP